MHCAEYLRLDALALAGLVRRGELAADAPSACALALIDSENPRLNALRCSLAQRAQQRRQALDRQAPFAGVPFLAKDMLAAFAGYPQGEGSAACGTRLATEDDAIVTRWDAAGLQPLGLTAMSEFALAPITNPAPWGPTRNPWNLAWNSGGSSGGSAAAVAAGWVPLAHGTDSGGSVRIPASLCGLFGMRPSNGLSQWEGPPGAACWHGAMVSGVLSRSVRDAAAYLDWLASRAVSYDPERPPANSLLAATQRPPPRLRVALGLQPWSGLALAPAARAATLRMAELLRSLGHEVEEAAPVLEWPRLMRAYADIVCHVAAAAAQAAQARSAAPLPARALELSTRFFIAAAAAVDATRLAKALACWREAGVVVRQFHQRYPVWLSPVAVFDRLAHTDWQAPLPDRCLMRGLLACGLARYANRPLIVDRPIRRDLGRIAFTPLANICGGPSLTLPGYRNAEGLPVGALLSAAPAQDALLLALAAEVERVAPWAQAYPFLTRHAMPPAGTAG